jgi:hypothetical protein
MSAGTTLDKIGPTRIGYVPAMLEAEKDPDARANNVRALDMKRLGCTMHEVALPSGDLSYFIEYVERAAAFDSLTRDGLHRGVRPRTGQYLRACRLVTAVDYLQANRRRLIIMADVAKVMATVDAVLFTTLTLDSATSLNPVMSLTGHPSIAVPNGFNAGGSPAGVMFSGHLYRRSHSSRTLRFHRQPLLKITAVVLRMVTFERATKWLPLQSEFAADGDQGLLGVAGRLRQLDEADAVKVALHRVLLVRGERAVGDDEVLATAEHIRDCGVERARVAAPGIWPAEAGRERMGDRGRSVVVYACQDHHHTASIFQNAIPTLSRRPGRTDGALLYDSPPVAMRVSPKPVPTTMFCLGPSSQL